MHVIKWSKTLPDPDQFKHSVVISVVIHGAALAVLNLLTYGLWVAIALCGNVAHQFLFKLTQWPISSGIVLPAIQKFPITVGFVLVSMAYGSCGGLALICAVLMYFIILSKMYEDYLEEFVFKTAAVITKKLFGRNRQSTSNSNTDIVTPALVQRNTQETQTNDESNNDKQTESDRKDTNETDEKIEENTDEKLQKKEIKNKKKSKKYKDKKVEFSMTNNVIDKTEPQPSTSESVKTDSTSDLDIKDEDETTIVPPTSQENFEVLYNQLDPADVAIFSKRDEVEEMTDEERKEVEKAEAGLYQCIFFTE